MTATTTAMSYKDTLNLPKTDFAMKAQLTQREPQRLADWEADGLYGKVLDAHASDPVFNLHDGPPFANGDIHIGHVLNKVLKDVVCRYQTMKGRRVPYVPGWDCHGLPIEHKVQQKLGPKLRELDTLTVRRLCREHAEKAIKTQCQQFKRLGILGDWDRPYLTMDPGYEARTLEVFAKFVENGLVYKRLKPVHWSVANRTALADAELEYQRVRDPSVFVEFPARNPGEVKAKLGLREPGEVRFMIWTTTPWTLPANLAIAVNPDVEYSVVRYDAVGANHSRLVVIASDLVKQTFAGGGNAGDPPADANPDEDWKFTKQFATGPKAVEYEVVATVGGDQLSGLEYQHPFVADRVGKLLPADYVTTTDGTGLVHTAPGHGEEDWGLGRANGLGVYCPVQADGRYDSSTPPFVTGLTVKEANPIIVEKLADDGYLFASQDLVHKYPHDWRSKTPTIYRATEQWFIAADKEHDGKTLRDRAVASAETTTFHPGWGQQRLLGMLANRPDWCISRQRAWGLPIPVFYNEQGDALLTPESVRAVAATFVEHGSDAWWSMTPAELLGDFDPGQNFSKDKLRKESDIFDVWFESGSSWHAVLDARDDLEDAPADLYLEGSDQHRGWFQLSLLSGCGSVGHAPFKEVLTHGFIVKPDGTKVSKSDKEYVTATQEIERHGADLLRLYMCSVDYTGDIRTSPEIIQKFGDEYRKIRNTIRFLLGNLSDFDPHHYPQDAEAAASGCPETSLDAWMLSELNTLIRDVRNAYDAFQTHHAYRLIRDFCTVQVSQVYGNAMKDRLYCEAADSPVRRRSQFVQYKVADALIRLVAPMLVFTSDEAWEHLPGTSGRVHTAGLPEPVDAPTYDAWTVLMKLRQDALQQLDELKKEVGLNKATDAELVYTLKSEDRQKLEPFGVDLADVVGAGWHSIEDGETSSVRVVDRREDWQLCARSRKRTPDVGSDPAHPDLSARDAKVVSEMNG
ncbi:MAG: isoleucine--tRNA ligase [Planctomycetota bacterium]